MAKLENIKLVDEMIRENYLNVQQHPHADLYLYNYSKIGAIYHVWNEVTLMCRGLICDSDNNIIARPFPKFFNYEEIEDTSTIPTHLPFEAFEKLDGSLGIMYWIGDTPYITTRGSFISEQGEHATKILHSKYSQYFDKLDRSKTYLFEIIYPENHLVVNYGALDDIFLLAVIDIETGEEDDIYKWSDIFKCTKKYDGVTDFSKIREMFSGDNREGFVIKFSNNFRVKLKYEEYFKLAFIKNNLSRKTVYEYLSSGKKDELDAIINELDEETQIYYKEMVQLIYDKYDAIENECKSLYREFDTDKEAAEYFLPLKYSGILFLMRKGSDYTDSIWRFVKKVLKED